MSAASSHIPRYANPPAMWDRISYVDSLRISRRCKERLSCRLFIFAKSVIFDHDCFDA